MTKKDRILTISEARRIATEKGVRPCKVKGRDTYEFSKSSSPNHMPLSWMQLEALVTRKSLAICESFGYLKIIKTETPAA